MRLEALSSSRFAHAVPSGMAKCFPAVENESSARWRHVSGKSAWAPDVPTIAVIFGYLQANRLPFWLQSTISRALKTKICEMISRQLKDEIRIIR
jgi:hypothetical protein